MICTKFMLISALVIISLSNPLPMTGMEERKKEEQLHSDNPSDMLFIHLLHYLTESYYHPNMALASQAVDRIDIDTSIRGRSLLRQLIEAAVWYHNRLSDRDDNFLQCRLAANTLFIPALYLLLYFYSSFYTSSLSTNSSILSFSATCLFCFLTSYQLAKTSYKFNTADLNRLNEMIRGVFRRIKKAKGHISENDLDRIKELCNEPIMKIPKELCDELLQKKDG